MEVGRRSPACPPAPPGGRSERCGLSDGGRLADEEGVVFGEAQQVLLLHRRSTANAPCRRRPASSAGSRGRSTAASVHFWIGEDGERPAQRRHLIRPGAARWRGPGEGADRPPATSAWRPESRSVDRQPRERCGWSDHAPCRTEISRSGTRNRSKTRRAKSGKARVVRIAEGDEQPERLRWRRRPAAAPGGSGRPPARAAGACRARGPPAPGSPGRSGSRGARAPRPAARRSSRCPDRRRSGTG